MAGLCKISDSTGLDAVEDVRGSSSRARFVTLNRMPGTGNSDAVAHAWQFQDPDRAGSLASTCRR